MRRRLILLAVVPAVLLLAACGGGGGSSTGSGQGSGDPFAQLRSVLAKFPYRPWYRDCIIEQVEAKLRADELEELAQLPEQQGRRVALRFALGAAPKCEARGREAIAPNPSHVQVQLLRVGYATTLEALGKREGLDPKQARCLRETIAGFPDAKVVALAGAPEAKREKMLVGVVAGCAE